MPKVRIEDIKLNNKREIPTVNEKYNKRVENKYRNIESIKIVKSDKEIKERKNPPSIARYSSKENIYNRNFSRQKIGKTPRFKERKRVIHKTTIFLFLICLFAGSFYWGGEFFHKANIDIKPKYQEINYDNKAFVATKNTNDGSINFEIIMISDKKVKNINLKDTKDVSIKSKGSVTFYNEFSQTPQKILAGSFISDDNGKAYKLDQTITIPGYKIDENKKIVPGSIIASLTSFLPGEIYNGSPESLRVSSFKNTEKYNKIYAKIKDSFKGGAEGLVYVLNDDNKKYLKDALDSSLKNDLLNQIKVEIPSGYILYPDASNFSYEIDENTTSKTPEAKVEVNGYLSVVIFKEESLINNLVKTSLPNITSRDELKEIKLDGINNLSFNFIPKDLKITKDLEKIDFSLKGKIVAIWYPDFELLKDKLRGVNKNSVSSIFKQDPGVASATVKIFPPWKKEIPNDLLKINLINKLTQ